MIRVVIFLVIVGALALGVAWLADRPADVVITWPWLNQVWPGHGGIRTSLIVLVAAIVVTMAVVALLWTVLSVALRSPFILRRQLHRRRGERAYEAISRGLIAIGAGDLAAARLHAAEVARIAPAEPLALLLSAQSAQLGGDTDAADALFRAMAGRDDTKALGLHGLYVEARRRGDPTSAHAFAEEAARESPSLGWAGKAVLEFRCLTGDWAGALALLESNRRTMDKETYRRQRAVMLTARANESQETDRDSAKAFAVEAAKLAPTFVPAASLAGRMLAESGDLRRASRILNKAWVANPHPDLAQVFSSIRYGDAARDRLKRIEALAKKVPGHIEGALAMARASLDAREFGKARAALASYLAAPTKRIALLMAELERAERNDEGRAREWIARAVNAAPDPKWTAEGHISDHWRPVSPSGRLDAFEWRVPVTGIAGPTPAIDPEDSAIAAVAAAPAAASSAPQSETATVTLSTPKPAEKQEAPAPVERLAAPSTPRSGGIRQSKAAAVIPLVHAPDDPGPDVTGEAEPQSEPSNGGWRKMLD